MAHKIAKLILENAQTFSARTDAVEAALDLGMPLNQIEEYLDWLETVKPEDTVDSTGTASESEFRPGKQKRSRRPKAG